MGIKEIKGRTLPGRSEEPSPDRPMTTILEVEGKHAAAEHQRRERSEFERRQASKKACGAGKKGSPLEKSEFERGGRTLPRLDDPADGLERYPHPPAAVGSAESGAGEAEAEDPATTDLWGDQYERSSSGDDSTDASSDDDAYGEEPEEEEAPQTDLWGVEKGRDLEETPEPRASADLWEIQAAPAPAAPVLVTPATVSGPVPVRPVMYSRTLEVPIVEVPLERKAVVPARTVEIPVAPPEHVSPEDVSAGSSRRAVARVVAPIPSGARDPDGDTVTQEVTAVDVVALGASLGGATETGATAAEVDRVRLADAEPDAAKTGPIRKGK